MCICDIYFLLGICDKYFLLGICDKYFLLCIYRGFQEAPPAAVKLFRPAQPPLNLYLPPPQWV